MKELDLTKKQYTEEEIFEYLDDDEIMRLFGKTPAQYKLKKHVYIVYFISKLFIPYLKNKFNMFGGPRMYKK